MVLSYDKVAKSLIVAQDRLRPILDPSASGVFERAKSQLSTSKDRFDARGPSNSDCQPQPVWGYSIDPGSPLTFRETDVRGLRLRVDMFLRCYWTETPADRPSTLSVAVRIWCLDKSWYFRPDWDAERLGQVVNPNVGRVMLRFHFDLANRDQDGPEYHLQVGGNARSEEYHWLPGVISLPRFVHPPVDLILAAELISASFYPDHYRNMRREPSWVGVRRNSASHFLTDYFRTASEAIENGDSVIDSLWNVAW